MPGISPPIPHDLGAMGWGAFHDPSSINFMAFGGSRFYQAKETRLIGKLL